MTNWGKYEHSWEGRSSLLITLATAGVLLYWKFQWVWLPIVIYILVIVTSV